MSVIELNKVIKAIDDEPELNDSMRRYIKEARALLGIKE